MAKWQYKKTKQSNWKMPVIVIVATLLTFMFIVPTIIVIPFKGDNATQASIEKQAEEATAAAPVTLDSPFDVNVLRSETDEVEKVPLEDYVVHVVASEMPADFELEALKAQALAARTYITQYLTQGQQGKLEGGADVTDTVQHQVYKNEDELRQVWGSDYHWKIEKITEAVAATQGKIITYSNQPITPAFFSTSNGYTENSEDYWEGELPYLRTVESPWDEEISPKFFDQKIFTKPELEKKLGVTISSQINDFQLTRTESKRVETVKIGDNTFSGRDIREKLGLPSNDFTITKKDDHYVFTTKGYGHGVGMSQYGANGMAKEGKTYEEIIEYYYQGVQVSTLEKATPKLLVKK
ncbi:stage II sporulation protein D [Gracilibacillus caseinilyticus]|uniref:Stage II sporulation protein D n=1 Tax=Gracilibacillus caseinilyticus TaxID=2932256 RepID=A0ABY4F732_9BACI|nr:stage II sporulation protein D [Gracilibacillus caseinilyticus]UOQ50261.1 stage II sporulation protein D [Gracilibacillus caseinilyticus]